MNVGLISLWFARGQAYVGKNIITALEKHNHNVFVMARAGFVHGVKKIENSGEWTHKNLTSYPEYIIPAEIVQAWIKDNKLETVVMVEEQWQNEPYLAEVIKEAGCRVVNVIMREAYDRSQRGYYEPCDAIVCPTKTCHDFVRSDFPRTAYHVPWGADLDEFVKARESVDRTDNEVRFFHPGGWGGVHNRRGTPDAIAAFKLAQSSEPELLNKVNANMLFTAQQHTDDVRMVQLTSKIRGIIGTIERDKLLNYYAYSDVAILPSMWEGLGLTFLEALASGLVIITNDAAPMSEFVNGENGVVLPPANKLNLPNIHTVAYDSDIKQYANAIIEICKNVGEMREMQTASLELVEASFNWDKNGDHFVDVVTGSVA